MKTFYSISLLVMLPLFNMLLGQTQSGFIKSSSILKNTKKNDNRSLSDWRPWQEVYYNWNSNTETWDLYTNTDFSYSGGHLVQSSIDYIDGTLPLQRISYIYNDAGKLMEEISEIFNGVQYVNQSKHVTLYGANGFETGYEIWTWSSNTWMLTEGERRVDEYNSDNKLTNASYQAYDYANVLWVAYFETSIAYDANHKMVELINRSVNGMPNILENDQKFYLKYASFSVNPDSVYLYSWDGSDWILSQRAIDIVWPGDFIPIVEDDPFSYVLQNDETGIWIDEERMTTTTTSVSFIQLTEHHINTLWIPYNRITREYDDWGNITLDSYEFFENNSWLIVNKDVYSNTYDAADRLFEVIAQFWNNNSGILEYNFKKQFLDYGDISGFSFISTSTINLFPNPANTFINVINTNERSATFQVMDALGKVCFTGILNNTSEQINVSSLPVGLYFIKVIYPHYNSVLSFVRN